MQALTSNDEDERKALLETLMSTTAGTGLMMHEGFDSDDPEKYTREWFSWTNSLFATLLMDMHGIS